MNAFNKKKRNKQIIGSDKRKFTYKCLLLLKSILKIKIL